MRQTMPKRIVWCIAVLAMAVGFGGVTRAIAAADDDDDFPLFLLQANLPPSNVTISVAPQTTLAAPATFQLTATASDPDGIARVEYRTRDASNFLIGTSTNPAGYPFTWANV